MRRGAALLALVLAGVAVAGCGKARTEAVIVVTTSGLRVPDDVEAIRVMVFDAQNPTPPRWDTTYPLCTDLITTGCVGLPFTMTLIPGPTSPNDSVRVEVQALRAMQPRIDDASVFNFSQGQSLRLDFVLYGNCLDMNDCAVKNEVCGPDRMCTPIKPVPFHGEPDLAQAQMQPPHDLGMPSDLGSPDMHVPPTDMAGEDMRVPPDLTIGADFAGCLPACIAGMCNVSCGVQCPCGSNTVCQTGTCVACGQTVGQPCCAGNVCNNALGCNSAGLPPTCQHADMGLMSPDMAPPADKLLTHWDPQTFSPNTPPSTLNSVSAGFSTAFAVGPSGHIWHLTSTNTWTKEHANGISDVSTNLNSVWTSSAGTWAVGDSGVITTWQGTANWSLQTNPFTGYAAYHWLGVFVFGSDVWIAGKSNGTDGMAPPGQVAHLAGGTWHTRGDTSSFIGVFSDSVNSGTEALLSSMDTQEFRALEQPTDAGGTAPTIFSYSYAGVGVPSAKVWGFSITQAWFVTDNGSILSFDGNTLSTDRGPTANEKLTGISGSGTSGIDLWAVGVDTSVNGGTPILLHASGATSPHTWTKQTNLPAFASGSAFTDVSAIGNRDLYIVGHNGSTAYIVHAH